MKGEIIGWLLLVPFCLAPTIFSWFVAEQDFFGLSFQTKNLIAISFFGFAAIYIKSFVIFYRKRLKVFNF